MSGRILHVSGRVGVAAGWILVYVLIWAGTAMLIAAAGIRHYWGSISVTQMRLNLVSVEADGGGGDLVWKGIVWIGVVPVLLTAGIAVLHYFRRRKHRNGGDLRHHRTRRIMRIISTGLVSAVVVSGTTAFATTVGVGDYIKAATSKYNIGDYYVQPAVTSGENKRNLVLIYLESGEATLADDQLFEKDAFAPLADATQEADGWQSVAGFQQYKGGGWTMAGLASTQCGIPLKGSGSASSSSSSRAEVSDDVKTYLGGATCLGDILEEQGYTSVFLGGASSSFAAKDTFLLSHGYDEVLGLSDWRAAGEPEDSFRSDWGLSDERLLAHAKEKVDALHAASEETGQPFNLSLLTLDTHEPVHVYDYCDVDTQDQVTSVFSCSLAQVAGFVDYMEAQGYLEDTAVVIMGDHLKHMSAGDAFHEQLDDHPNRTVYNRIRVPGQSVDSALRPGVDQLSMYPTILEAAGLTLQDRSAGLGVSAFAPAVPEGSAQGMEPYAYAELLDSGSGQFYTRMWAGEDTAK